MSGPAGKYCGWSGDIARTGSPSAAWIIFFSGPGMFAAVNALEENLEYLVGKNYLTREFLK